MCTLANRSTTLRPLNVVADLRDCQSPLTASLSTFDFLNPWR